jgi:phospholipid transport system substrate-binding protein
MLRTFARPALLLAALLAVPALAAPAPADAAKPVKTVFQSVRYGRDLTALKLLATEAQGSFLLGEQAWKSATPAQREEFTRLFKELFGKKAFPAVRENFKNLDTVNYGAPESKGAASAEVPSVVFINHPLKKQEMKLRYTVVQEGGGWKVMDVAVLGDSMMKGIKADVDQLMREGGWDKLLGRMREEAQKLQNVKLEDAKIAPGAAKK